MSFQCPFSTNQDNVKCYNDPWFLLQRGALVILLGCEAAWCACASRQWTFAHRIMTSLGHSLATLLGSGFVVSVKDITLECDNDLFPSYKPEFSCDEIIQVPRAKQMKALQDSAHVRPLMDNGHRPLPMPKYVRTTHSLFSTELKLQKKSSHQLPIMYEMCCNATGFRIQLPLQKPCVKAYIVKYS